MLARGSISVQRNAVRFHDSDTPWQIRQICSQGTQTRLRNTETHAGATQGRPETIQIRSKAWVSVVGESKLFARLVALGF